MKNGTYIKYYLSLPSSYHRINLMKILFFDQSIASVFHGRSWPYSFMWSGHFRELRRTGQKGIKKKSGGGGGRSQVPSQPHALSHQVTEGLI